MTVTLRPGELSLNVKNSASALTAYVSGIGVASMRHRVQALGGTFDLAPAQTAAPYCSPDTSDAVRLSAADRALAITTARDAWYRPARPFFMTGPSRSDLVGVGGPRSCERCLVLAGNRAMIVELIGPIGAILLREWSLTHYWTHRSRGLATASRTCAERCWSSGARTFFVAAVTPSP